MMMMLVPPVVSKQSKVKVTPRKIRKGKMHTHMHRALSIELERYLVIVFTKKNNYR